MNLIEKFSESLTTENLNKIAGIVEETPENTKKAIDGIHYTLLAGLIKRTSGSSMGLDMLYKQIKKAGSETNPYYQDLSATLLKKERLAELQKLGEKQISQIFPAFKSPLINMIGNYSEIKKPSASVLTILGTTSIVELISKEISSKNLDSNGLTEMLISNHEGLFQKAPQDFIEKMIPALGLQELLVAKFVTPPVKKNVEIKKVGKEVEEFKNSEASEAAIESLNYKSPVSKKLLLIIGAAIAVVAAVVYWYVNRPKTAEPVAPEVTEIQADTTLTAIDTTQKAIDSSAVKKDSVAKSAAVIPTVGGGEYSSFGEGLITYLKNPAEPKGKTFPMSNVKFFGTKVDPESVFVVDELAEILAAHPTMQVVIQGFDKTGNKAIATKRAFGIKQVLLNKGINNTRIDAVGVGAGGDMTMVKVVSK